MDNTRCLWWHAILCHLIFFYSIPFPEKPSPLPPRSGKLTRELTPLNRCLGHRWGMRWCRFSVWLPDMSLANDYFRIFCNLPVMQLFKTPHPTSLAPRHIWLVSEIHKSNPPPRGPRSSAKIYSPLRPHPMYVVRRFVRRFGSSFDIPGRPSLAPPAPS